MTLSGARPERHLRLVEPLPEEEPCPTCSGPTRMTVGMVCPTCGTDYATGQPGYTVPAGHPSTWTWPPPVDTGPGAVEFRCPECGKVTETDRPVLQRWCTGNTVLGERTHAPVRMDRIELRD